MTREAQLHQQGRVGFRSMEEKEAYDISRLRMTEFRWRMAEEKRVEVLALVLARLENTLLQSKTNRLRQHIVHRRLKELGVVDERPRPAMTPEQHNKSPKGRW